jgi:cytoskeletal protein RodZ
MKTVSELLRKEREKRKYTLSEISEATKIGIRYIEAIEAGDYSVFSSNTNAKGFINNYAKFLDLNLNEVSAVYRREQAIKDRKLSDNTNTKIKIRKINFSSSWLLVGLTLLVTIGIISYLIIQYKKFDSAPLLKINSPSSLNQTTTSDTITITGKTDLGDKVLIDGESIPLPDALGDFTIPVTLHTGANIITVSATNNFGKKNSKTLNIIYMPPTQGSNDQNSTTSTSSPLSINLSIISQPAWIDLSIDNKTVLTGIIQPNTTKTYSGKSNIDIKTARATDTILIVNNQTIALSGNGVVEKEISIDSNNNLIINP